MYWLTEQLLSTPVFSKIMKCDRFLLILKFLHFNNNDDLDFDLSEESRDWLHKIRPFLDLSCERFRKVYQLGKTLSVDESLVLFKGRLKFKQYIKTKRSLFGIKCELATYGITLDLLVYSSKGMFREDDPNSDMPATERIPCVLMEPFLRKGHVLYTDNFYTSPALASHFLKNKTHLCGTIWSNCRNYSKEITSVNLQKLQAVFYKPTNGSKMLACKYCANKDKVSNKPKIGHMLSTCHQMNLVPMGKNDKDGNAVVKPALIREYNLHMGRVDCVDQQLHSVSPFRNMYKWYKKLAIRIIMQMVLNAQKIYVITTGQKMTFLQFIKNVVLS